MPDRGKGFPPTHRTGCGHSGLCGGCAVGVQASAAVGKGETAARLGKVLAIHRVTPHHPHVRLGCAAKQERADIDATLQLHHSPLDTTTPHGGTSDYI